jgi:hypothetical protein
VRGVLIPLILLLWAPATMAQETAPGRPPAATSPPAPGAADIAKAVSCATLSQQFADQLSVVIAPTAKTKLDDGVKKSASDQATAGRKACMDHDYDSGLGQLRQSIVQIGAKPVR